MAKEIAGKLTLARSTVAAWVTQCGLERLTVLGPNVPPRRYQRRADPPGHQEARPLRAGDAGHQWVRLRRAPVPQSARRLGIQRIHTRPYTPKTKGSSDRLRMRGRALYPDALARMSLCDPVQFLAGQSCRSAAVADLVQSAASAC
jgi:hypothetical protein